MDGLGTLVIVAALAGGLGYALAALRARSLNAAAEFGSPTAPPGWPEAAQPDELRQIATDLLPLYQASAYASDLLDEPLFRRGVEILCAESYKSDALLGYYTGDSAPMAFLALEALSRRQGDPDVRPQILDGINDYVPWTRYFALRALDARTPKTDPLVGRVLARVDGSWSVPLNLRVLREFLEMRAANGEPLKFGTEVERLDDESVENLTSLFDRMPSAVVEGLRGELTEWRSSRIDHDLLNSIGRVWEAGRPGQPPILDHPSLGEEVTQIESIVTRTPQRSVLLVGEHGVGKTSIARSVAARMMDQGWIIWEAGHTELIAGMSYVGQLEGRLRELLEKLSGRRVLWLTEEFHALALSGRHRYGPVSVLDYLLPYVESGNIVLIGETQPRAFERLVQSKPRVLTALEVIRVDPLSETETLELVDKWAETHTMDAGRPALRPETRREAWLLAEQYLGDHAAPGNVLSLLELTRQRCAAGAASGPLCFGKDDVITTLGQLTGLPATVLDERKGLDLGDLRRRFESQVMGQPEAIDCLVERVAMIKAGVTDPTRPFGVFLFAGPTGTGKTEIAKTLAGYLFGSPDRMIRLDMSELQDPESIQRLIGATQNEQESEALVDAIRKQPFSVVLLDEFEKAHGNVWDLFLQVFDDGRLTDRAGNTADFRNAIVIMTSNLGSRIAAGASLGFTEENDRFSASTVHREVKKSFRPEFLNRLDRVIVFRPLERDTMRTILRKDLSEAFKRRGLRNRAWAVEWDESAVEFLLERGFTADLGARPLKRAIERHVLAPLATTIVNHQYPEGDQFLFVRVERDELIVEFVDPDAAEEEEPADDVRQVAVEPGISLGRVALEPKGRPEEIAALRSAHAHLRATVEDPGWHEAKRLGLERTRAPHFWNSESRYAVLGGIEYLDRIEAGVKSAGSLLERLSGYGARTRPRYPRDLLGRLASQLFLLDAACRSVQEEQPREAFVLVEVWSDAGSPPRPAEGFARKIGAMYCSWAATRRMQYEILEEPGSDRPYRLLLAVSGYAAYSLLAGEHGLHLLETPEKNQKRVRRAVVRVRVAAQPETPPRAGQKLAQQAATVLAGQDTESLSIVRRYREEPSPLVRDVVKGWRTGKLDCVLRGNFDLLGDEPRIWS